MPQQDGVELPIATDSDATAATGSLASKDGSGMNGASELRLERVIDSDGLVDDAAFGAVEAELGESARWRDLAALYEVGVRRAPDGDVGRTMMLSAGLLLMEQLGDASGAERWFRRVLASDPDDFETTHAYAHLLIALQRYDEGADLLDVAIALASEEEKVDLCMALARVAHENLDEGDRAVVALGYAHSLDPTRLDVLEGAFVVFVARERYEEAKQVLDAEARVRFGDSGAPSAPDDDARRLGESYRTLGVKLLEMPFNHALAQSCLERARALGDNEALSHLDALAAQKQDWTTAGKVLDEQARQARDKRKAAALYVRAAELHLAFGEDPIKSDDYLNRALILVPGFGPAVRFVERAYLRDDRPSELAERLRAIAMDVKDPAAKVAILTRIAQLTTPQDEPQDDDETIDRSAAIAAHRATLEVEPGHRESVEALSALLSADGQFKACVEVLENYLDSLDAESARIAARLQLGQICAAKLGASEQARAHFEAVLELQPDNFSAASALRALHTDAGHRAELLDVLRILVEYSPDLFSRLDLLHEMAHVADEIGPEAAFDAHRQIFQLDPNAKNAQEKLTSLAGEINRLDSLAETLVAAASRQSGKRGAELWIEAGGIYADRLHRAQEAAGAFKRALELDPDAAGLRDRLETLLRERDDPDALVDMLESQLARAADDDEKASALGKLGDLLDRELDDPARAAEAYNQLLEIGREDTVTSTLASLDDLYGRLEDWPKLQEILVRRSERAGSEKARAALDARRAKLLAEHLGEPETAASLFLAALPHVPDSEDTIDGLHALFSTGHARAEIAGALEPLFDRRGAHRRQVETLQVLAEAEQDPAKRADLARRAARLLAMRLADPQGALEMFAVALDAEPSDAESLEAICIAAAQTGLHARLAETLDGVLSRDGLEPTVVSTLSATLASLYDQHLDKRDAAISAYRRALEADGKNAAAIAALERLYGDDARHAELAQWLVERTEATDDDAAKVQLGLRLAALRQEHLDDADGAAAACRDVLAIDPRSSEALSRLTDILERQGQFDALVKALDGVRDAVVDASRQVALDVRAGGLLREKLDDPKGALARYTRALASRPNDPGAIKGLEALLEIEATRADAGAALEPIYTDSGSPRALIRSLEARLSAETNGATRAELFGQIAGVQMRDLGQPEDAYWTGARAYKEGLVPPGGRADLVRTALSANLGTDLARMFEDTESPDVDLLRELARLYDGPVADNAKALATWKRLLDAKDGDEEALAALERLHGAGEDPSALAEILLSRAESATDDDAKVAIFKRASAIYEELVEDIVQAAAAMESARQVAPSDRNALHELERLYDRIGDDAKVADVLAADAELVEETAARADVLAKLGRVNNKLGREDQAVAAYAEVARLVPDHNLAKAGLEGLLDSEDAGLSAASALEPIYRAAGQWQELVDVYERLADATDDRAERAERLVAIRSIYEERLGRADKAFSAASRAFKEAPKDEDVLRALERLARASSAADELVALLEDHVDTCAPGGDERYAVRARIARFLDTEGQDQTMALAAWRRLLDEWPGDVEALEAIVRLGSDVGDEVAVSIALEQLADVHAEPSTKADHLRAAARIIEGRVDKRDKAISIYEHVLELMPKDAEALGRLDKLYAATGRHAELQRVLTESIEVASPGKDRAVLRLRLGRLRTASLGDHYGAIEALAQVLATDGEGSEPALEGAAMTLDDMVETTKTTDVKLAAAAAVVIEPYWAAQGDHRKVVEAKEARAAAVDDIDDKRSLLIEIAGIYETALELPEMAFLAMTRAYRDGPGDEAIGAELERLAELGDTHEELVDLYGDVMAELDDESVTTRLSHRSAEICLEKLDRPDAAVVHYDRILSIDPNDEGVLQAILRIHERTENAGGQVSVYRRMLGLPDSDEPKRKQIWSEIARILESDINDPDAAIEAYGARIAMDPTDREAIEKMVSLADREAKGPALADGLERLAAMTEHAPDKAQYYARLGVARRDLLDDNLGAVEAFASALDAQPNHPGAVGHLAAIAQEPGPPRARAAAALAPIYFASGAYDDFIACAEAQLAAAEGPDERKPLLISIGDAYETKLGKPQRAFTALCRALHEDPRDGGVRAHVERLAQEHGLHEDLAGYYLDEVDTVNDGALALMMRRRVADIYDEDLKDYDRAIKEHMKILEVAPGDLESLKALERLYRHSGSFGELAEVYRRRIAQTDDTVERAVLMRELAHIQAEQLDDASGAIATLRRLLELEPDDLEALSRLAALCRAQKRYSELADVLQQLIDGEGGEQAQLESRLELARLKIEQLGDPTGGMALFRELLDASPGYTPARAFLRDRLEEALAEDFAEEALQIAIILSQATRRTEEWQALIEVLRVQVNLTPDPTTRVNINREIATTFYEKLRQPELAFATLTQAFRDAPGIAEIRAQMEAIVEELLMVEDLVEVYEAGLESIADPDTRLEVEIRTAELLEQHVGDRERAATAWERVLARRPMDDAATAALDRLNTAMGRWAALTDILEKRIEIAGGDDDLRHELTLRLGMIWEDRVAEPDEALRNYEKALQLKSSDPDTLRALARLYDDDIHAEQLHRVLSALVEQTSDDRQLLRLLPRLATLCAERFEQHSEAISLWEHVRSMDPGHSKASQALEGLYEREGRWESLAEHLQRQLESARDDAEVTRLQRRLGFIKGTRLGSVDEAVQVWTSILKRNPNDVEALEALRKTYRRAERWDSLVATVRKLIPLQVDAEGVKALRFELAEVFLTNLDRRDEAIESAKRVLDVEPLTVAEMMRLEEIFVAAEAFHDAIRVMNQRAAGTDDAGAKADILFNIASLYENRLSRRANAASAYERILTTTPGNTKAYDALTGIYESSGDYRKLVELHNRRLEQTEERDERRRLLSEIIEIQEKRLGHKDLGFTAACRAFAEEGADLAAQAIAERLAAETGSWEILVEVFEEQIEQVPLPRAIELRKRLAEIYLDEVEEPVQAERHLDHVLSLRPDDDEARGQMVRMLESQERWRDLVNLLRDQVEIAPEADKKKDILRRVAQVEKERLNEVDSSIATMRSILEIDASDELALEQLASSLRETEQWRPLIEVLERLVLLADSDADVASRRFDVAAVWDECIDDVERAISGYREVLQLDPAHVRALKALEHLYAETHRFSDLLDVYEQQVTLAQDDVLQINALSQIAKIQETHFEDRAAAAETLIRVLHIDGGHLPTVRGLERIWRDNEDWPRLAEAYRRHIEVVDDVDEKVEIHLALADVHSKQLSENDEAEAALKEALRLDPESREAVHGLGELYEANSSWFNALEMLQREANMLGSVPSAVDVHFRMGNIHEHMLSDVPAAKSSYQRSLKIDPGYSPALRALGDMHRGEDRFEDVLLLQSQEAEHAKDPETKADLYQAAAETALDQLDDIDAAIRLYNHALDAVQEHIPSARALADLYFVSEEWERSERLLELLVERLDSTDDRDEVCRQYYRLAYISEKLGDDMLALERYLASHDIDGTYLPTLEGLAGALLRTKRWEDAQKIFQTILVHHRDALTSAEVVDLYFSLGELATRLGQREQARRHLENALELDPNHPPTLRAYAQLCESLEDWEEAYDMRSRLIDQLRGTERFEELQKQAVLCEKTINDPYRAIDAYAEARRMQPESGPILEALGHLYRATGQHPQSIEAYEDLSRLLPDGERKRDVWLELGSIHYKERSDVARSADALNLALDLDPSQVGAFSDLEQMLAKHKQWPLLEENYRRMIQRLSQGRKDKAKLAAMWRAVGDLHREVFKDRDQAAIAYKVVMKLQPKAHDVGLTLAQMLSERRETVDEALQLYHRLLPQVDNPEMPARALSQLYAALGRLDQTLGALAALVLMRAATAEEQKAYAALLKRAPSGPTRPLTDKLWRGLVFHKDCRNSLADVLSVLYRGAPQLFSEGQVGLQLKKKEHIDLGSKRSARTGLRFFSIWREIATALQVGEVEHYHRVGSALPPRLYPGEHPVLFAGAQHEIFRELPTRQIIWSLSRQMACARPELAPVRGMMPEDVAAIIEAAIRLYVSKGSGVDLPIDARRVQGWMRALQKHLSERAIKALRAPVQQCYERQDLSRLTQFLEGVEHTASRAAVLMAGDIRVVERGMTDPDVIVEMNPRRRARHVMFFLVSDEYFTARAQLGLQIPSAQTSRAPARR